MIIYIFEAGQNQATVTLNGQRALIQTENQLLRQQLQTILDTASKKGIPSFSPGHSPHRNNIQIRQRQIKLEEPGFPEALVSLLRFEFPESKIILQSSPDRDEKLRNQIRGQLLEMRQFPSLRPTLDLIWSKLDVMTIPQLEQTHRQLFDEPGQSSAQPASS